MGRLQYVGVIALAALCAVLSVAVITLSELNGKAQRQMQEQDAVLNSGLLGPRGREISGNLLQDMADSATTNTAMRALLAKHGFNVQTAPGTMVPEAGAGGEGTP